MTARLAIAVVADGQPSHHRDAGVAATAAAGDEQPRYAAPDQPYSTIFTTLVVASTWCAIGIVQSALPRTIRSVAPDMTVLQLGAVVSMALVLVCISQVALRQVRWTLLRLIILPGIVVGGVATYAGVATEHRGLVLVGAAVTGLANGTGNALGVSMLAGQVDSGGASLARYYVTCYGGMAIGPSGVGSIAERVGLVSAVAVGEAVIVIIAAALLLRLGWLLVHARSPHPLPGRTST
ncbi:hypothetical protein IFT73_00960 [Aeromicrobium sp. CFBP 8757]|uniref:hypothetical protein n=1 Tax=Aeromicrobium sp. CFBP 8757 TaxID=2775288 RepID=UPI00177C9F63|nr:hypothetical protein [Aeromicrobium sp. CFBP 8757]MBD8605408.1 hypothetical protein [Aeromicrobium sp. CFBP 8757]